MSTFWESDHFASWNGFKQGGRHKNDPDLNLLYRFDWDEWDPQDGDDEATYALLKLYYVMQRKACTFSVTITVSRDDEPEICEWLRTNIIEIRSPL
jgi:hypothetical protein